RPGGVIAYVTCSPHLAETREVVGDVTAARDDVTVLDAPALLSEVPGLACPAPAGSYAQFWPHRQETDAIFLAVLQKGPAPRGSGPRDRRGCRPAGQGPAGPGPQPGRADVGPLPLRVPRPVAIAGVGHPRGADPRVRVPQRAADDLGAV